MHFVREKHGIWVCYYAHMHRSVNQNRLSAHSGYIICYQNERQSQDNGQAKIQESKEMHLDLDFCI